MVYVKLRLLEHHRQEAYFSSDSHEIFSVFEHAYSHKAEQQRIKHILTHVVIK